MRVNHNCSYVLFLSDDVVSDLCKDTKMRVNHNEWLIRMFVDGLFLIYAKILK